MKSLYVTVTADSEFVSEVFPADLDWWVEDDGYQENEDGTAVVLFGWHGERQDEIEQALKARDDVVSYQIL